MTRRIRLTTHCALALFAGVVPSTLVAQGPPAATEVGLAWTAGPAGTKSYVIIMQDTDGVRNGMPFLHWTMLNIPANVTKLDAGMTSAPAGSQYGQNYRGMNQPYLGPRTPAGPKHRYHVQVFALDAMLTLDPNAPSTALMTARM